MPKLSLLTIFPILLLWTFQSIGQSKTNISLYKEQLPYFQELITGGQYKESPLYYEGNPYFKTRVFVEGSLLINGVSYTDVPLLYDQNSDVVLTFHPIHRQKILIKSEKIEEFQIDKEDLFRKFEGNSSYTFHKNGFYQVLDDGIIKVIIKNYKMAEAVREVGKYTHKLEEHTDYFYWFDGKFIKINRKKQAIKALGLSRREVKKAFRSKSLFYTTDKEKYILELVKLRINKDAFFNGFVE